jgi:hypothetical protein
MSKTPINNLTKEQFLKEFEEGMDKISPDKKITKEEFLNTLLMKGILNPEKYFEFIQE